MRLRAIAAVAALLAFAAGCGGGAGKQLSRDAYVEKADAICREVVRKERALPVPSSIAEIPGYVDGALPIIDGAVKDLRSLRPPKDMEDEVNEWLKQTVETRSKLEGLRSAAQGGDADKVRAVSAKVTAMNERRDALARSIGLTDCAST
jgi:hypothetical protein